MVAHPTLKNASGTATEDLPAASLAYVFTGNVSLGDEINPATGYVDRRFNNGFFATVRLFSEGSTVELTMSGAGNAGDTVNQATGGRVVVGGIGPRVGVLEHGATDGDLVSVRYTGPDLTGDMTEEIVRGTSNPTPGTAAPTGAAKFVNTLTGEESYVDDAGNWQPSPSQSSSAVLHADTNAGLQGLSPMNSDPAWTQGARVKLDGGGQRWDYNQAETPTLNFFHASGPSGVGRYEATDQTVLHLLKAAIATGVDQTASLQAAFDEADSLGINIVVPATEDPFICDSIYLYNNVSLIGEKGAKIQTVPGITTRSRWFNLGYKQFGATEFHPYTGTISNILFDIVGTVAEGIAIGDFQDATIRDCEIRTFGTNVNKALGAGFTNAAFATGFVVRSGLWITRNVVRSDVNDGESISAANSSAVRMLYNRVYDSGDDFGIHNCEDVVVSDNYMTTAVARFYTADSSNVKLTNNTIVYNQPGGAGMGFHLECESQVAQFARVNQDVLISGNTIRFTDAVDIAGAAHGVRVESGRGITIHDNTIINESAIDVGRISVENQFGLTTWTDPTGLDPPNEPKSRRVTITGNKYYSHTRPGGGTLQILQPMEEAVIVAENMGYSLSDAESNNRVQYGANDWYQVLQLSYTSISGLQLAYEGVCENTEVSQFVGHELPDGTAVWTAPFRCRVMRVQLFAELEAAAAGFNQHEIKIDGVQAGVLRVSSMTEGSKYSEFFADGQAITTGFEVDRGQTVEVTTRSFNADPKTNRYNLRVWVFPLESEIWSPQNQSHQFEKNRKEGADLITDGGGTYTLELDKGEKDHKHFFLTAGVDVRPTGYQGTLRIGSYKMVFEQDATGGNPVQFNGTEIANKDDMPEVSIQPDAITTLLFYSDGSDLYWIDDQSAPNRKEGANRTISAAGPVTVDLASGNRDNKLYEIVGDTAFTFDNFQGDDRVGDYVFLVKQPDAGGTFSNVTFTNVAGTPPMIDTANSAITRILLTSDGNGLFYRIDPEEADHTRTTKAALFGIDPLAELEGATGFVTNSNNRYEVRTISAVKQWVPISLTHVWPDLASILNSSTNFAADWEQGQVARYVNGGGDSITGDYTAENGWVQRPAPTGGDGYTDPNLPHPWNGVQHFPPLVVNGGSDPTLVLTGRNTHHVIMDQDAMLAVSGVAEKGTPFEIEIDRGGPLHTMTIPPVIDPGGYIALSQPGELAKRYWVFNGRWSYSGDAFMLDGPIRGYN